ncbi:cupin domain-containing protein [Porticoccus sp.]|uniref:cupin domain-containing protein n=1 Tax=Porticoccus sp. TaxID=2024853 RepID=UPI000C57FEA8|nr:cupin domain-containing protein [Porticoccus sp.]MAZ71177.1 hypothetical protein [Porticoccus sp.]|tara:strand:- start:58 stop:453 length:396 start_codon:yes stop_codon:yes gene_type:complete
MKFLFILVLVLLSITQANASKLSITDIHPPENLVNIYVEKLSSDQHASDFIVFVKQFVPLHKHLRHTETIYILDGTGLMRLGDEEFVVGPGDFIKVPEGTPHGVKTTSTSPLKALSVQAPEFLGDDRVFLE